ncbi:acyl-CoA thioesterase, partial [Nocardioides sp. GCM10030258]|uniref:acyl-CoA thioesterase n=1 Tax=unclassified Nocardioides TaxID=2615069 RepID=UPI003618FB1B
MRTISATLDAVVTDDLVDANDHLSLPHYVRAGARAVWTRKESLGLEEVWSRGLSFFITEQHTTYSGELLLGERFTVHPRFLHRSARSLHTMTYVVNAARDQLTCSIESVSVFVSRETRDSVAMPAALAESLDAAIRHDHGLPGTVAECSTLWRPRGGTP